MEVLVVTFYKRVFHGMFRNSTIEKEEFKHSYDANKSYYENMCDAYDIAVSKGHDPHKNILFKRVIH